MQRPVQATQNDRLTPEKSTLIKWIFLCLLTIGIMSAQAGGVSFAKEVIGWASFYTVESCLKEGTSGIMASGEVLNDEELICASWDYIFGTRLKITNLANGKSVIVVVKDRGPAKRLYRQGRIIDLSKKAFSMVAPLSQGIIKIKVEVVERR